MHLQKIVNLYIFICKCQSTSVFVDNSAVTMDIFSSFAVHLLHIVQMLQYFKIIEFIFGTSANF